MATEQKKKNQPKKHTNAEKKKPTDTKRPVKKGGGAQDDKAQRRKEFSEQYMPYIMGALGFLFTVFFVMCLFQGETPQDHPAGVFGYWFCRIFFGLFGWTAFFIPVLFFYLTAFWRKNCREGTVVLRSVLTVVLIVLLSAVVHVFVCNSNESLATFDIAMFFNTGAEFASGGVIGGMLGWVLFNLLKVWGTLAIAIVAFPLLIMVLIGVTPAYVAMKIKEKVKASKEAKEEQEENAEYNPNPRQEKPRRKVKTAVIPDDEEDDDSDDDKDVDDDSDDDGDDAYQPPKTGRRKPTQNPRSEGEPREPRRDTPQDDSDRDRDRGHDPDDTVRVNRRTGEVIEDEEPSTTRPVGERRVQDSADTQQGEPEEEPTSDDLYLPGRPNARDRQERRNATTRPPRRDEREDDGLYTDDLPEDTDTMEVSMDDDMVDMVEDDGELVVPPRHRPVTGTSQEELPRERERIVVVVHEQDPTAVTSTSTHQVDGLADEEVVLPSGTGEAGADAQNEYCFPPIDLMVRGSDTYEADEDEITRNIDTLRDVLESFHIRVKEVACSCGPTITRYEVKPDQGVRVRSIANLVDDIAMGLAKSGVRIEAPIPGKAAVGIEVPNEHPATVYLRNLIETPEFKTHKSPIASCLGADVSGRPVIFDINKMPHLLVAGATGMGKSVCINSIIMSILYKATPEEVKLILIDPKKVEFTMYRDLPHLYAPIVSDPKKAAGCLNSAVNEMERRFELIEEEGVRNIAGYNEVIANDPTKKPMPRIVIIIDEFADLMMTASQEVETAVCRLAQKARAAGIHLIIGTQRPSVDVITGLIKANIPSRIAFTVASARDSMTILDMGGADKLIGRGDMLYAPVGASKPMRVQGTFVSDSEVERVVTYIKEHNSEVVFDEGFVKDIELEAAKCGNNGKKKGGDMGAGDFDALGGGDEGDDKYWAAVEVAVEAQKISTSLLQRRLNLGYGRAAKIIDRMEEMGFVGPADGNKPRKLLITKQDLAEIRVSGRTETEGE